MVEGKRVSRISVRGFAVASATAVTTVGAAVGVASGEKGPATTDLEVAAADASLLAEIPAAGNAQLHTTSLSQQAETQTYAAEETARQAAAETARQAAADQAAAKKAEADKKAEEKKAKEKEEQEQAEREAREAAASRSAERTDPSSQPVQASYSRAELQAMAREIVGGDQYQCFSEIVERESNWDHTATNPSSGAYGLMQALPGSKMSSVGDDWRTNPATQIQWGLNYMNDRYGSPCAAFDFWQANHWY